MIRYDLAALDIESTGLEMKPIDGKWYMMRNGVKYYDAPTKEALIEAYCNHDLQDYTYPDNIKCECGNCHEETLYFECPGCLSTVGYCYGGSDKYWEYCNDCWNILEHDLVAAINRKPLYNK